MSLLESLQKKKKKLKSCKTKVTKLNGEKYEETLDARGKFKQTKLNERHAGYIVDDKPDLQVAEILPYLTLGSQDVVNDPLLLKRNGITHVLSLGVHPCVKDPEIVYRFIDLLDLPEEDLSDVIEDSNALIKTVKSSHGKIFVHCNAGCSRAPSVVIAYLMATFRYSFQEAFQLVDDKRYIRPNDGFVKQLEQFELLSLK